MTKIHASLLLRHLGLGRKIGKGGIHDTVSGNSQRIVQPARPTGTQRPRTIAVRDQRTDHAPLMAGQYMKRKRRVPVSRRECVSPSHTQIVHPHIIKRPTEILYAHTRATYHSTSDASGDASPHTAYTAPESRASFMDRTVTSPASPEESWGASVYTSTLAFRRPTTTFAPSQLQHACRCKQKRARVLTDMHQGGVPAGGSSLATDMAGSVHLVSCTTSTKTYKHAQTHTNTSDKASYQHDNGAVKAARDKREMPVGIRRCGFRDETAG